MTAKAHHMNKADMTDHSSKESLEKALLFLANPVLETPDVVRALQACLEGLRSGTAADQRVAELILERFAFPGSTEARSAVVAIHAALQTSEGRRAAGLRPQGRGVSYDPDKAAIGSKPYAIVEMLVRGELSMQETLEKIIEYFGAEMSEPTARRYVNKIRLRVEALYATLDPVLESGKKLKKNNG